MQEVDLNDDGVIDYSEFLTLVKVWLPISFKYYLISPNLIHLFSPGQAFGSWVQEEEGVQTIAEGNSIFWTPLRIKTTTI